ncbi:hypothetical protein PFISCL1PPCAC_24536, partial [Pristionchus fissidentatus]
SNAFDSTCPSGLTPDTMEVEKDRYGFQPLEMVVSVYIPNDSALLFIAKPLLHILIFFGLCRCILPRGRHLRNIGRSMLLMDASMFVAHLAYHLPNVISTLKVSINGQSLNGFYIYTLSFVFFCLSIWKCHSIVDRVADILCDLPERSIIYFLILYIIFGKASNAWSLMDLTSETMEVKQDRYGLQDPFHDHIVVSLSLQSPSVLLYVSQALLHIVIFM